MIRKLERLGTGLHYCGKRWFQWSDNGWLEITKEGTTYVVMWTSHKNYHNPLTGSAFIMDYLGNGRIGSVYRSVITLWRVDGESEKSVIKEFMNEKIILALKTLEKK